jgi:hypothetical protein
MALNHTTYLKAVLRLDRGRFAVSVPDVLLHIQDGWHDEDEVEVRVEIERIKKGRRE